MTKQAFKQAAAMVRAILAGEWTNEPPTWANHSSYFNGTIDYDDSEGTCYPRAVQTAEAFILLFSAANPRFNAQRFLVACGLVEPAKKGKR